jgi:hypothetical protein
VLRQNHFFRLVLQMPPRHQIGDFRLRALLRPELPP